MIFPAVSSIILYGAGDPYADGTQYGDTDPTAVPYGSDYGTGTYSEYNSESGRYTVTIEIAGYGTGASRTGKYGYTAGGPDTGSGTMSTASYRYGDGPNLQYDTDGAAFDDVIDILDGDAESGSGDAEIYMPVEINT